MTDTANAPHKSRFTSANAKEMARRAKESRERNKLAKLNAPPAPPPVAVMPADEYLAGRITSARAEIERLTKKAAKAVDALDCERLARAVGQWSEVERIAAGRPLPGSKKPGEEKPAPNACPQAIEPI